MTFWILTGLLACFTAATIALALLRRSDDSEPAAAYDLRVYRDQLRDVDRDLARGTLQEADAERLRTEISRRILAADAQVQKEADGGGGNRGLAVGAALACGALVVAGAVLLYLDLGVPGEGDLPLSLRLEQAEEESKNRLSQSDAEARIPPQPEPELEESYKTLLEKLREAVAQRPDDLQGNILLAQHESNAGNYSAAVAAKSKVIDILGEQATAMDHAELAELMIIATGGYVSAEAEAALRTALDRDPQLGPARYYWGMMLSQIGRPDLAFNIWEQTLRMGPPDAPWLHPIRAQIGDMAYLAGVDYQPPAAPATGGAGQLSGPSAEDMEAAGEMSAEDRQEMIRGMVDRLSDRLATEGGGPEEWARLIGALGVLGETSRAKAIYDEAKTRFDGNSEALAAITEAARSAGLTE
ncbi:c-type cytochrome biogenesis protein CcmI [Primorskyibacter sp. S87]|uniref:c-type cytochrome biogenesis protein CcmI n=1 Tax=Primorskyibacter sp. S87 TaxID=3415126 RepID=UPI003C7D72A1